MSNMGLKHRGLMAPTIDQVCRGNASRSDWLRDQLTSFAEHIRSTSAYNPDQIARALDGIAEGREWTAMVWR